MTWLNVHVLQTTVPGMDQASPSTAEGPNLSKGCDKSSASETIFSVSCHIGPPPAHFNFLALNSSPSDYVAHVYLDSMNLSVTGG